MSGGWRKGPNNGGVPLAVVALLVLPLGLAAWRRWGDRAPPDRTKW